jgi:hypothetical protein
MGNGLGHMNAYQKAAMGWLDGCNNLLVTREATFEMHPIQWASDEVQSLQIPTGDHRDGDPLYYYVEYRNPELTSFNTSFENSAGVHVDVAKDVRNGNGDRRSLLLDLAATPSGHNAPALTGGRSFEDPDGRVSIEVVATTSTRATVKVSFPHGGTGENRCNGGSTATTTDGTDTAVGPDEGVRADVSSGTRTVAGSFDEDPRGGAVAVGTRSTQDVDAAPAGSPQRYDAGCQLSAGKPAGRATSALTLLAALGLLFAGARRRA